MAEGRPDWQLRLPNQLTCARLLLAVLMFVLLALPGEGGPQPPTLIIAAVLFLVAALTDALDGHLARRWDAVSVLGRILDPFADKLLILGSFVLLAGPGFLDAEGRLMSGVTPWMAVVILGRELLVTTIRAAFESRGADFSASWSGKIKMILQSCAVPILMIGVAWQLRLPIESESRDALRLVASVLAWMTVLITAWSAIPYVRRAISAASAIQEH